MILSKQKELSDKLIKHTNQEVVVYHQKQKKLQKLNKYVLPDTFSVMLRKTAYKHALKINASKEPSQYQLAKKLASLFWIKAVKTDRCNIYFKETKLGKLIQDKLLNPVNYNHVPWSTFELIIPIIILSLGGAVSEFFQSFIPVVLCSIVSISMELLALTIDDVLSSSSKTDNFPVYKCIAVLRNHMNPKDLKYESLLLKKYAVKRSD